MATHRTNRWQVKKKVWSNFWRQHTNIWIYFSSSRINIGKYTENWDQNHSMKKQILVFLSFYLSCWQSLSQQTICKPVSILIWFCSTDVYAIKNIFNRAIRVEKIGVPEIRQKYFRGCYKEYGRLTPQSPNSKDLRTFLFFCV